MERKIQVFIIHGGMTFKSKKDYLHFLRTRDVSIEEKISWSGEYLKKKLGVRFDVIKPRMPMSENAKYEEWKITFDRYIPLIKSGVILIGNSLGGIFLAKYLSENKFPKRILSTYLICPPYDNSLSSEDLAGGFTLKSDLTLLEKNTKNLHLMFSSDDEAVPLEHADKYRQKLKKARFHVFDNKNGHFRVSDFPELVKSIKADAGLR